MNRSTNSQRLKNEIHHGKFISQRAEQIWHWSSVAGQIRIKRRCQMFVEFIGNKKKKILEVGCGTGILTKEIAKTNNLIYAVDISPELLNIAKKKIPNQNVIFKITDACNTHFKNCFFDYIIGSSILHHLEINLAIKEFYRILKRGGKIMFTEPNMLNPQIALERNIVIIRKLANNSPDETAFFRWRLQKEFINVGFRDVYTQPFDFLHPALPSYFVNFLNPFLRALEVIPVLKEFAGSLIIKAKK